MPEQDSKTLKNHEPRLNLEYKLLLTIDYNSHILKKRQM